ncbi:MAG: hypothetical protein ACRBN8_45090 [Nannocystales bacterium]
MRGRLTERKALHLSVSIAAFVGCTSSAPEERASPAPTEQAIVVEDDTCGFHGRSMPWHPLYAFPSSPTEPVDLESLMTQIRLVRTTEAAVGTTTTFDVLHTFVGPRATRLEWEHGGALHPINEMIEPHRIFALFELAPPPEGVIHIGCAVPPVGPFIRDIDGSQGFGTRSPLARLENVENASNREIARVLAASLPIGGATTIRVGLKRYGSSSATASVDELTFLFHPPPSEEEMKRGVMLPRPMTSISIVTALRLDGTDTRVLLSGRHSSPIGEMEEAELFEQLEARERGPVLGRRFQALAQEQDGEMKIVSTWFESKGS